MRVFNKRRQKHENNVYELNFLGKAFFRENKIKLLASLNKKQK
jgi:hypothetical protein